MLAKKGWGKTGTNPLVGAVVVKNNRVVGRGYHRKIGEAHAETSALIEAGRNAKGATLYVNLEPCCTTGRTPPCAETICKANINRVVIGMLDPNPMVNGKGIEFLRQHNIKVTANILSQESNQLNLWYKKYITQKVPYIIVKIAASKDGRISDFKEKYITSEASRRFVHSLRSQVGAVLVGINTVLKDNPYLTDRLVGRNNPARIAIDPNLRIPLTANFLSHDAHRIIITSENNDPQKIEQLIGLEVDIVFMPGDYYPIETVFQKLGSLDVGSILIEGGGILFSQVISKKLYDELYLFVAPKIIGEGLDFIQEISQEIQLNKFVPTKIGEDLLYYVHRNN